MKYKALIAKQFEKVFKKLPKDYKKLVIRKLKKIETNPFLSTKIISAKIGKYRVRVGVYRIRFDIVVKQVHFLRILHRKEAYRKV